MTGASDSSCRQTDKVEYLFSVYERVPPATVAAHLLRLWVRIPPGACVLSGRGLCDEPITRPEESYRLWCVVVCDQETS